MYFGRGQDGDSRSKDVLTPRWVEVGITVEDPRTETNHPG